MWIFVNQERCIWGKKQEAPHTHTHTIPTIKRVMNISSSGITLAHQLSGIE